MTAGRDLHRVAPADIQLVPEGGKGGQLLAVTPGASPRADTVPRFTTRDSTGAFVGPFDFSGGAAGGYDFLSVGIPGGALGPNGVVRFGASGAFTNAAGADRILTVSMEFNILTAVSGLHEFLSADTTSHGFLLMGEMRNLDSEITQTFWGRLEVGHIVPPYMATGTPPAGDFDTSVPWTLGLNAAVDAGATTALIHSAWYEVVYLP